MRSFNEEISLKLVNELKDYVSDVHFNEDLLNFIDSEYQDYLTSAFAYDTELKKGKTMLLNFEKKRLETLFNLEENTLSKLTEIDKLFPYIITTYVEPIKLYYNYHLDYLNSNYLINIESNNYLMFNIQLEKLEHSLLLTEELIASAIDNELYIVSEGITYLVTLNEIVDEKPYIFNSTVYLSETSDLKIYVETMNGELLVSKGNLDPNSYTVLNNIITIDKDYLLELFDNERNSFIFGLSIYKDNTYYLQTVHILRP